MEDELLELQVTSQEEVDWSQIPGILVEELPLMVLQLKGIPASEGCLEPVQEHQEVVIQEAATDPVYQEGRGEV